MQLRKVLFLVAVSVLFVLPISAQTDERKKYAKMLLDRGILLLPHAPKREVLIYYEGTIGEVWCLNRTGNRYSSAQVEKSWFQNHDSLILRCNDRNVTIQTGFL